MFLPPFGNISRYGRGKKVSFFFSNLTLGFVHFARIGKTERRKSRGMCTLERREANSVVLNNAGN